LVEKVFPTVFLDYHFCFVAEVAGGVVDMVLESSVPVEAFAGRRRRRKSCCLKAEDVRRRK